MRYRVQQPQVVPVQLGPQGPVQNGQVSTNIDNTWVSII